jgi:hypothetical protein
MLCGICIDAREIPIFIFSLDMALPVLIDRQYQSKALPGGMVIAVQSLQHLWYFISLSLQQQGYCPH